MGYLTTITILNDALEKFENHPADFAQAIFDGINRANRDRQEVSVPFHNYGNYINVQPSRHADDTTVYLHHGNGVTNLDSTALGSMDPEWSIESIDRAIKHLKNTQDRIKAKHKLN